MAGTGWNPTNVFVGNPEDRFVKNHISGDGFLKNVIRAGINKWFNDLDRYLDENLTSSYGYDYNQGYGGGFGRYNSGRF